MTLISLSLSPPSFYSCQDVFVVSYNVQSWRLHNFFEIHHATTVLDYEAISFKSLFWRNTSTLYNDVQDIILE